MTELNEKNLEEVNGGMNKEELIGSSIDVIIKTCEKCGMPLNSNGVCPLCNLQI